MPMQMLEKTVGSVTVLSLEGSLHGEAAERFGLQALQLLQEGKKYVVFDFGAVTFMGTAGMKALAQVSKRAQAIDGRVILACLPTHVRDILDMAGFLPFFEVYPSVDDALKAFQS